MKITFERLQIVDAIERHGSFTAAATALHRVPSALSHAIAKLEDELGVSLFIREGRRATLNPAGRALLEDGRHLLRAASDLERRIQRIADGWEAELRIALDAIIPVERLFPVLGAFYAEGQPTQIRINAEVLAGTWDALLTGRADLAIGAPGDHPACSGISSRPLIRRTEFIFAIAPEHPLASWEGAIPRDALLRHRAVVIADTSRELDARTVGLIEGQDTLRVPDIRAKADAQIAGLGVGHLPRWVAEPEIAAGRLVEKTLADPRHELPINIAWRNRQEGRALRWFLDKLAEGPTVQGLTHGL